jgi:ferrochelatase
MSMANKTGVVLMTYGSATTAEHVREYFESVYQGRVSKGLTEDFENRYRLVGRSPLVEITRGQAGLLQERLGKEFVVRAGMRHLAPGIAEAVGECRAAGAGRLVGVVLSPQFSSFIMDGYAAAFAAAARLHGFGDTEATMVGPWPIEEHFVELLAQRVKAALFRLQETYGTGVPIVFTTHSLPKRVVDKDPAYLSQLRSTIDAVLAKLPPVEQYAAYQSAGHTPEEWLKPDLTDVLAALAKDGKPAALIVPIQFLADHLEILYDLDIAAQAQCKERGIAYHRIELPNTAPLFIDALASVVLRAV